MTFSVSIPVNPQGSLFPEIRIFEAITEVANSNLFQGCLLSLRDLNLTRKASSFKSLSYFLNTEPTLGLLCTRVPVLKQEQIESAKGNYPKSKSLMINPDAVYQEFLNPGTPMLNLDIELLPADAMAFYRSFHFEPFNEWGIYLYVEELMKYCDYLYHSISKHIQSFTPDILLNYVLFEIFHHEFFHHIVECAATTLEIISSSLGYAKPIYMNYREHKYESIAMIGTHKYKPLEEALANAYPYNSLSFLTRMQGGYEKTLVKLYKKLLELYWPTEPAGYRSASSYTGKNYIEGAGQLLAMLLPSGTADAASLMLIGKEALMNGNSAYFSKPEMPTYLVGSKEKLLEFTTRVPCPLETYTKLFLPDDTAYIDDYINKQIKDRKDLQKVNENGATA